MILHSNRRDNRLAFVAIAILVGLSSCVSTPKVSTKSAVATDEVEQFLSLVETGCDSTSDQAWQTASRKKLYGQPICHEDRGLAIVKFKRKNGLILTPIIGGGACHAVLPNVSVKNFDIALDEVMQKAGFQEFDVIYVTVCNPAKCNGRKYCRVNARREFYREADELRITASYGSRGYPRVQSLFADYRTSARD